MSFIFDKLAPPLKKLFKIGFKSFLVHFSRKKLSEVLKTWYFLCAAFCSAGQWGKGCAPPLLASLLRYLVAALRRILVKMSTLIQVYQGRSNQRQKFAKNLSYGY